MNFVGNERGPVPTRAQLADLQTQAENACRCARRPGQPGGRPPSCWHGFEQAVNRFPHFETSSACVPLPTTLVCFGGMDNCIVRDEGGGACTQEEARTLEAIWTETTRPNPFSQQLTARAEQRMQAAVQAFSRGERVAARQTTGGCSG